MKKSRSVVHVIPPFEDLVAAANSVYGQPQSESPTGGLRKFGGATNYRQQALNHYKREVSGVHTNVCVMCGFGLAAILEVAHLDQNRKNNSLENLALLCPNCHKMHDIGLIPSDVVIKMRDMEFRENWALRIKDAGSKAASTKLKKAASKKRAVSASKAWDTRRASLPPKNGEAQQ